MNFRYSAEEIKYCLELADVEILVFGPEFMITISLPPLPFLLVTHVIISSYRLFKPFCQSAFVPRDGAGDKGGHSDDELSGASSSSVPSRNTCYYIFIQTIQTDFPLCPCQSRPLTARCSLTLKPHHMNANNVPMGGAIFTLADFTCAVAANGYSENARKKKKQPAFPLGCFFLISP